MSKNFSSQLEDTLYKRNIMINFLDKNDLRSKKVLSNFGLVIYEINNRFFDTKIDFNDLIQIGLIGLIKAVDSFDISRNNTFSSYACKCIDNEILLELKKVKKALKDISMEEKISLEENEISLKDTIVDEIDIEEYICNKDEDFNINNYTSTLSSKQKQVIELYFGFNGKPKLNQKQIGKIFNYSQSNISRLISASLKKIKKELLKKEKYQEEIKQRTKTRAN